jgi:hypothetical protein
MVCNPREFLPFGHAVRVVPNSVGRVRFVHLALSCGVHGFCGWREMARSDNDVEERTSVLANEVFARLSSYWVKDSI